MEKALKCIDMTSKEERSAKAQPMLYLLEAEIASLQGTDLDGKDILSRYSEVAQAISVMKRPHIEALALELTGKYLDSLGQTTFGAGKVHVQLI